MKYIASENNPTFRRTRSLATKKDRDQSGRYLIEGPHLVGEALAAGAELETVWWARPEGASAPSPETADLLERLAQPLTGQPAVELIETSAGLFRKLSDTVHPQGILAVLAQPTITPVQFLAEPANGQQHYLVLDRVQDPGNVGTLLRTAFAAGFRGVVSLPGTADEFSLKVVRAASGSLFRLPVLHLESPAAAIELFARQGISLVAACPHNSRPYFEFPVVGELALVIGNEAAGVAPEFLESAQKLMIPMAPEAESLNAAVAGGILMFWARQLRRP